MNRSRGAPLRPPPEARAYVHPTPRPMIIGTYDFLRPTGGR
jgi:hypothetical protein